MNRLPATWRDYLAELNRRDRIADRRPSPAGLIVLGCVVAMVVIAIVGMVIK